MKFIREFYSVPAKRGGVVNFEGRIGRITSAKGSYLKVKFKNMNHALPFHPDSIEYLNDKENKNE